jgi:hypothetical protein
MPAANQDYAMEDIYPNDLASAQNFMRSFMPSFFHDSESTAVRDPPEIISQWDVFDYSLSTSSITNFQSRDLSWTSQDALKVLPSNDTTTQRDDVITPQAAGISVASQAFKDSPWLWEPDSRDRGGVVTKDLKSVLRQDMPSVQILDDQAVTPFTQDVQDAITSLIVKFSHSTILPFIQRALTTSTSAALVANFLKSHQQQAVIWLHSTSFDPADALPELLLALIVSGAALSHEPKIRSLASILFEPMRAATAALFERDNQNIRSLQPLQTYALMLDIGLWSGDSRQMEISESFAHSLNTMMRRGGQLRAHEDETIYPTQTDDLRTLQLKWHLWVATESIKRLSLHLIARDTASSICFVTAPLLSQSEISLAAPACNALWAAQNHQEWAQRWSSIHLEKGMRHVGPHLRDVFDDVLLLASCARQVDVRACIFLTLANIWSKIWRYLEMQSRCGPLRSMTSRSAALVTETLLNDIEQCLSYFKLSLAEICPHPDKEAQLHLNHQYMVLYAPMEDIQVFAGKHGENEAHQILDQMKAWASGQRARQAVWHGGQILRYAKEFTLGELRGYTAVALYHASVVFWAYSILAFSSSPSERPASTLEQECVLLDGEDGFEMQRFVALGRGVPTITLNRHMSSMLADEYVPINSTKRVMTVVATLLRYCAGAGQDSSCSMLVQKLTRLICTLGWAAEAMNGSGSS